MSRVLLVYATKHGHTAKISERLAEALRGEGLEVDPRAVENAGDTRPRDYDGVIVGASIHAHQHQSEIVDWVKAHHTSLESLPSAFFSVSLTAAEDTDEAREATRQCIDEVLDDTGWTPTRATSVAGALQYREYDVFTRTLIRLMMRRAGHTTDISQDHEYTDWDAVERFGCKFASLVTAQDHCQSRREFTDA